MKYNIFCTLDSALEFIGVPEDNYLNFENILSEIKKNNE